MGVVDGRTVHELRQVLLHHAPIGQTGQAVVIRLKDEARFGTRRGPQGLNDAQDGSRSHGQRQHTQHHAIGSGERAVLKGEQGRHDQRDGDNRDTPPRCRRSPQPAGLGEHAHRRVERRGPSPHVGQGIGQVQQSRRHVDEVDVRQQIHDVANEHERHGGHQQPERRHALLLGVEREPQRHHHHEDRHARVRDHHERHGQRHFVAQQPGLDRKHPGHGGQCKRCDEAVQGHARPTMRSPHRQAREAEQPGGQQRVSGQSQELRQKGAARAQVAKGGAHLAPCSGRRQEQPHCGGDHGPGPPLSGPPATRRQDQGRHRGCAETEENRRLKRAEHPRGRQQRGRHSDKQIQSDCPRRAPTHTGCSGGLRSGLGRPGPGGPRCGFSRPRSRQHCQHEWCFGSLLLRL